MVSEPLKPVLYHVESNIITQDRACARYDHTYPYLVNQDSRIGDESGRKFQFPSCSGAITTDVLEKQVPHLDNH